ncbi:MAG: Asp23/Gls24 family envelope stress response protein [Acidobacteria bacterium]|nr:Asp23/Gls24 family envelope stress response protein [Acidobacteriota bacterium]
MTDPTDDLDGHTIEELADYVDRGRTPVDPAIETSPGCRHAIAALERLRSASSTILAEETAAAAPPDETWLAGLMSQISLDARAGADFTLLTTPDGDEVVMTEGALRALVRAAGDEQPGFLVGRVRFDGDLSEPESPLTVRVDVVVGYGTRVPAGVDRLRTAVIERLRTHTMFRAVRVDIDVRDLLPPEALR